MSALFTYENVFLLIGLAAICLAILLQVLQLCWSYFWRPKVKKETLPYEPFHDDITTVTH